MLSLYRRGRVWHVRGKVGRQYVRRSCDTTFRDVASERAREIEKEALSGLTSIPWKDFETEYVAWVRLNTKHETASKYSFVARRFGRFLKFSGVDMLQSVSAETISAYRLNRAADVHPTYKRTIGPEGIKSDMRCLRRMFTYAVERGYIKSNPINKRTAPNLNTRGGTTLPFEQHEIDAMLSSKKLRRNPWLRAIIVMFLNTGLRIGDIIEFPMSGVHFADGTIVCRTKKRDKTVTIPMSDALRQALTEHLEALPKKQRDSLLLFPTRTGQPAKSLDAYLRRFWKSCGIAGGHAHRFRDTFAVRLLAAGATLYDVAKLLGITVGVAEKHYAPYSTELRERARKLVEATQR